VGCNLVSLFPFFCLILFFLLFSVLKLLFEFNSVLQVFNLGVLLK
jgi:hypothetical protein